MTSSKTAVSDAPTISTTSHRVPTHLHPLFMDVDAIGTPAIDEIYAQVRFSFEMGATSCAITAPTGTGKTRAIMKIRTALTRDFDGLCTVVYNTQSLQQASTRGF